MSTHPRHTLYSYDRLCLLNLAKNHASTASIEPSLWQKLKDLNIAKCTKRGNRAGRNKLRHISVRVTTTTHHARRHFTYQRSVCYNNLCAINSRPIDSERPTYNLPSVFLCNPRSLNNKFDKYRSTVFANKAEVCAISESWFTSGKPLDCYDIPEYQLYTKSRSNRAGGGVACYVKSSLTPDMIVLT